MRTLRASGGTGGHERGTVEDAAERFGELAIGHGVRGDAVERGVDRGFAGGEQHFFDQVVDVDPGHVLVAGAERAAEAEVERRQHFGHGAAVFAQDDADADRDDANAQVASGDGLFFPADADFGQKIVARRASARRALRRRESRSSRRRRH